MDPEQWCEPTKFKPERFINDEGHLINKERVIPFSLGELFICLAELI
jgi:cytochrome P450